MKIRRILVLATVYLLLFFILGEITTRFYFYLKCGNVNYREILDRENRIKKEYSPEKEVVLADIIQLSDNDGIVYELVPGAEGAFRGEYVKVNSAGLRDHEYSIEKPDNIFRIAGVGDSVMFGWGVELDDSYLKVLERKLNQMNSPADYEVINFAVPGYNAAMEVAVFEEKVREYGPDLVIFGFCLNDMTMPTFIKKGGDHETFEYSMFIDLVLRGVIDSHFAELFGSEKESLPEDLERIPRDDISRLANPELVPEEYSYMVGWEGYSAAMTKLSELSDEWNITVVQINWNESFALWEDLGFAYVGFPWNLSEYRKNKSLVISEEDVHPSATAHRQIAESIYNGLLEQGLIPAEN